MNRRPRLELHGSTASPEEAAAVIAAIEQFLRDTAPPPASTEPDPLSPWVRAARPKGVEREPHAPRLGVTGRHGGPIVPAGRFPTCAARQRPQDAGGVIGSNAALTRNLRLSR